MLRKLIAAACFALLAMPTDSIAQTSTPQLTSNKSVTITTGGTFQTVLAYDQSRKSLTIENNNATDNCWISFGRASGGLITAGNATKSISILLTPGGSYTRYYPYLPPDEIEGTCANNNDTLYIDVQ